MNTSSSDELEHAKAVLSNARIPIVEAALSVGFNTQAHFSTVFKKFTGQTPAQWRRTSIGERRDQDLIVWVPPAKGQRPIKGAGGDPFCSNLAQSYKYARQSDTIGRFVTES